MLISFSSIQGVNTGVCSGQTLRQATASRLVGLIVYFDNWLAIFNIYHKKYIFWRVLFLF